MEKPVIRGTADIAIIGAGMAGLTAARELARAGKSVALFEASTRCGGRAYSLNTDAGAVELGAEFVHGSPAVTLRLAEEAGVRLLPIVDRHFEKIGKRFRPIADAWRPLAQVLEQLPGSDFDCTAEVFLRERGIDPETSERFRHLVEGFEAAPINEIGIRSLQVDSSSLSGDASQYRVEGGYKQLVNHLLHGALEAGVRLHLAAPVAEVAWRPGGPISLGFREPSSSFHARACVIAVPISVLQAPLNDDGLAFSPAVPLWAEALTQLGMGQACRVTLRLSPSLHADAPVDSFIHLADSPFETFWCEQRGADTWWTAWAGGPKAQKLAALTEEEQKERASSALARLLDCDPETLAAATRSVHHHDFSNDVCARGAYAFARPFGSRAADALSTAIQSTLYLAGEATDDEHPGTVAGAIASGLRAARQVLHGRVLA